MYSVFQRKMKHKKQMKIKNEAHKLMAVMSSLTDFGSYTDLPTVLERLNSINPRNLPGDFSLKYYVIKSEIEGLLRYTDPTYVNPVPSHITSKISDEDIKPVHDIRSLPPVMRYRTKKIETIASAVAKHTATKICGTTTDEPATKPTGGAGSG